MPPTWTEPWWTWRPEAAGFGDWVYRLFNLAEGLTWLVFSGLVIFRWWTHRRSGAEWVYAAAFAAFGVTDFVEATFHSIPLLVTKGGILAGLLCLRHRALRHWYPGSRLY